MDQERPLTLAQCSALGTIHLNTNAKGWTWSVHFIKSQKIHRKLGLLTSHPKCLLVSVRPKCVQDGL
jgi:hypothetical protein